MPAFLFLPRQESVGCSLLQGPVIHGKTIHSVNNCFAWRYKVS